MFLACSWPPFSPLPSASRPCRGQLSARSPPLRTARTRRQPSVADNTDAGRNVKVTGTCSVFCFLLRLFALAVNALDVKVYEDVAWFGTFARADDAPVLQFVHDARGPAITQAQAALQQ